GCFFALNLSRTDSGFCWGFCGVGGGFGCCGVGGGFVFGFGFGVWVCGGVGCVCGCWFGFLVVWFFRCGGGIVSPGRFLLMSGCVCCI
ncbi:hypothetical protein, partial [Acinetobacter baumannii]|uniref:hypothetical protein n=1 Tax=Acinetobacter baumannii TaxID=470 RepID=UPI001BC87BFE